MAISWITALKVVPWSDVVRAAPHVVKGARALFNSAKQNFARDSDDGQGARVGVSRGDQITELQERIAALAAEQQASAELIGTLAEQNARVVAAIEILRVRTRVLLWACALLAALVAALGLWIALR